MITFNKQYKVGKIMNKSAAITVIKLPKNYVPSDKEEYMCDMHLAYFNQKLLDWKRELIDESNETLDHLQTSDWGGNNLNSHANTLESYAIELRTRGRYKKLINKIDKAIKRIYDNEYGYCEETGEQIGLKRLIARPIASLCLEAQRKHETYEKQHIDEDDIEDDKIEVVRVKTKKTE